MDHLERTIRQPLPPGYREYITHFGEGIYSDNLEVWMPRVALQQLEENRAVHSDYFQELFLDWREQPITEEDADECVELAGTANGDAVVICPSHRGKMFVLPRHDDQVQVIDGGFCNPKAVVSACFRGEWEPPFEFFDPSSPQRKTVSVSFETECSAEALATLFEERFSKARTHREQIGEGPGRYCRVFVEALGARVNISRNQQRHSVTLHVTLDIDQTRHLEPFLADACEKLKMVPVN